MKNKCLVVFFVIIIFSSFLTITFAVPNVDTAEKVYDFADLFTPQEEENLYNNIIEFINDNQLDMVIVTINENNKYSAEAYADDFYDYNNFGIGDRHDGLLFLIDMDTRNIHISTTGKAILIYDDNRIGAMLDNAYYYIVESDYYEAGHFFISDAEEYIEFGIPSSNNSYDINEDGDYVKKKGEMPYGIIAGVSFLISGIFIWISSTKHKSVKKATNAELYVIKDSLSLSKSSDRFVNSHTSSIYVPRTSSSSSGGGSSTHRGSSGRSHGGGSRRF